MGHEGTVVADRFEIASLAGRGGMGTVYRARDWATGTDAAVKILHAEAPRDHRERFEREGRVLAELTHPAFVRLLGHGEIGLGQLYLAMEWLDGEDLAKRLKRTPLGAGETVRMIARIAFALDAAHARGIIHRDIKPSNLFLVDGSPERVKVLDFGIARVGSADATRTGTALGTPRYMAPEQARGSREIDARADVFSLGCVLYECLAGRPPFAGQDAAAVFAKILLEDAPLLTRDDLPRELGELVARMLSKQPDGRPRTGAAVAAELEAMGDLGDAPPRTGASTGVTTGEQRLVCVVFAAGAIATVTRPLGAPDDFAPTITVTPKSGDRSIAAALASAVTAHRGRAEILADGSLVVTLFGQGVATDQAARAARCALAVRAIVPHAPMALAIGRTTIEDRFTLGELIDRAVALSDLPGAIHVDAVTAGLLDVRFAIEGDVLSHERDVAQIGRTLLGRPIACVGRERELGVLDALWRECVAEPLARAVVVAGAVGVGKSRLRYELVQRLGVETWIGRGDPMTAGAPFAMLAQALRRICAIVDDEPAAVRHGKLRARVARHVAPEDAPRVAEFLGELIGAETPDAPSVQLRAAQQNPQLMGDQMLRACEDLFAAECAVHPVLLVLEDLQWSDASTVQFIDAILRRLDEQPLMVLALARPDIDTTFPRLWSARRVERINLGELTRRAAEKLVREALGEVAPELVARVIDRAAGNAFYLEELIRSVAEGHGDRLPATIVAMAQARIEDLELEARHVLRAASIFGQVFWRGGVAALVEGEVTAWLDELVRRELVTGRRDSRFGGEVEYTFRHALVREAAYAMLTARDLETGHRAAGTWLEAAGESDAVALAEHFLRGGEPARSVAWYRRAAELALEGHDLASTIEFAERAIACAGEPDGTLRLLQAGAHVWRGEYALAVERGDDALARLLPGSAAWLAAAAHVIDASGRRLDHARVLALCAQIADLEPEPAAAHAIALAMTTLLWQGAPELVDRLFALLDRLDTLDPTTLAWIYTARAWRALRDGDHAASLVLDQRVEECFTAVGDQRNACRQHANVGYGELMLGAFEPAVSSLREAIAIATHIGLHQVTAQAQHNLGLALARLGEVDEGRAVEIQALAAFQAQDNRRLVAAARNYLALIELAAGNPRAAIDYARGAVEAASDKPASLCNYKGTLSLALRAAGDARAALDEATEAMALVERHGRPEEGEFAIRLAYIDALRETGGDPRAAIADAAAQLRETAEKIRDPERRRTFLTANVENAAILAVSVPG